MLLCLNELMTFKVVYYVYLIIWSEFVFHLNRIYIYNKLIRKPFKNSRSIHCSFEKNNGNIPLVPWPTSLHPQRLWPTFPRTFLWRRFRKTMEFLSRRRLINLSVRSAREKYLRRRHVDSLTMRKRVRITYSGRGLILFRPSCLFFAGINMREIKTGGTCTNK